MSTYEILTIILTVFSGLIAVSAIIVPIILNYLTKRAENKINSPKKQDELMFKEYRLKYLNLVDELTLNFSNYITSANGKAELIGSIYKLKFISDSNLKVYLDNLLKQVQNNVFAKDKLISLFNEYLEEIDENDFEIYWYGAPFDYAHSPLINQRNKK